MKLYNVFVQALYFILKTSEHLATLLSNIEESRHKNKYYLNQYKSGVKSLAKELERFENRLFESQSKFQNITNPEPGHLRMIHCNLALTA
jgi:hypothetical protein